MLIGAFSLCTWADEGQPSSSLLGRAVGRPVTGPKWGMRPRPKNRVPFINAIQMRPEMVSSYDDFPFCLPAIKALRRLAFQPAVTFFVGENGSGKSTLLEAIAVRLNFAETGGEARADFGRRPVDGGLHDAILVESNVQRRPADRFFMRADTMFEFANFIDRETEFDQRILRNYGKRSLHQRSHGEAFLDIVQNRLKSESLFILDEPEAAL